MMIPEPQGAARAAKQLYFEAVEEYNKTHSDYNPG